MIDISDEVRSVSTQHGRRRTSSRNKVRAAKSGTPKRSLNIERVFSDARTKPFDQVEWEHRTAEITDDAGKVIFKQENVEVPKTWSLLATKVVVSKYFYGEQGT